MGTNNVRALAKTEPQDLTQYDAQNTARVVESIIVRGDISNLSPSERAKFYVQLCEQLGLNPASQPLVPLKLNGKEILYVSKVATDQLAAMHRLNREIIDGPKVIDLAGTKLVYAACRATHPNGRVETAVATVPLASFDTVLMKAETKAKRRATLSILGLGLLDESEIESIPARERAPGMSYVDAEPIEPTPLELLRDDLSSAETIEAIKASYQTHADAIDVLDGGEYGPNAKAARTLMCERVIALGRARGISEADALLKNPTKPAVVDEFERAIDAIAAESTNVGAAIVEACVKWKAKLAKLAAPWNAQAKTYAAQAYGVAMNIADTEEAREKLTAAVRDHGKPTPPDGGQPTSRKRSTPAADAQGAANESGEATGPMARARHLDDLSAESPRPMHRDTERYIGDAAAWEKNCEEHRNTFALRGSWAKHVPGFRTAGVARERLDVAIERYITLAIGEGRDADEASAEKAMRISEEDADTAARLPTGKDRRAARKELDRAPAKSATATIAAKAA